MKKKILILGLCLVMLSLAGAAFAAYQTGSFNLGSTIPLTVNTSKNVQIEVLLGAVSNPVNNYTITSFHQTGSKTYGSSNKDAKLYVVDGTGSSSPDTIDNTAGFAPGWSGWAPL